MAKNIYIYIHGMLESLTLFTHFILYSSCSQGFQLAYTNPNFAVLITSHGKELVHPLEDWSSGMKTFSLHALCEIEHSGLCVKRLFVI